MVRIKVLFILCFFCVLSFTFSDEFAVSDKNHNNLVYTYVFDNTLVRKEYDSNKRLIEKTIWDISTDAMVSKENYKYLEKSMFPLSSETVLYLESKTVKKEFSDIGKETKVQTYFNEDLILEVKYSYDLEGRVISHKEKKIELVDEKSNSTKKQIVTENQIDYEYVDFNSKTFTNEFYYENQIKTKEKIYLSSTKYYETTYFEDDISIYSEFENGVKQVEITYFQGKELRRK